MRLANSEPKAIPAIAFVVVVVVAMTENNQTGAGAHAPGGLPFYEQSRTQLKALLTKRRELENRLVSVSAFRALVPLGVSLSNIVARARPTSRQT